MQTRAEAHTQHYHALVVVVVLGFSSFVYYIVLFVG